MMYTRAQAIDFDSWKTEGWDYKSLLPLLKRVRQTPYSLSYQYTDRKIQLENFHPKDDGINQDLHGHDGPINVSYGTNFQENSTQDLLAGARATGEKEFVDMQDFESTGGFAVRF